VHFHSNWNKKCSTFGQKRIEKLFGKIGKEFEKEKGKKKKLGNGKIRLRRI